jgi:DHA1 family multidrug resistance protein B-like MFS transporter
LSRWFGFLRGNILVMTICECVWRSSVDIIWPFLSLYVLELGGSYETIGLIMSGASLGSMILYPLGGYIADYQGRIKLIGYMTFVYALAFLIIGFGESWQWLALGLFIQNMTTLYWPAIQALMADSILPKERGVSFAAFESIPNAVGLLSPVIGAWLISFFGMITAMRGLFFSSFIIASGIAFYRVKALKETISSPKKLDLSPGGIVKLIRDSYIGSFGVLSSITREYWTLSSIVAVLIFSASLTSSFWVIRVTQVLGLSLQEWATIMMVTGIVGVILGIPIGRLVDRVSKRLVIGVSCIAGAVLVFSFLGATSFYQVALIAVLSAVLDAFLNSALRSFFADITPRGVRGRTMALVGGGGLHLLRGAFASSIFGKLFQTSGTFLSGYLYSVCDSLPWTILSGTMLVVGILVILLVRDPENPEV